MASENNQSEKRASRSLLISLAVVVMVVLAVAVAGFLFMNKPDDFIEGQAEGTTVRISGKLPGRIVEFYVQEGDSVHAGDTLVCIHSAVVEAQLTQAEAMQDVARARTARSMPVHASKSYSRPMIYGSRPKPQSTLPKKPTTAWNASMARA